MEKDNLLEKLSHPISEKDCQSAELRKEGRPWIKRSRQIALSALYFLEKKGMNKNDLAERMDVDISFVDRILEGKVNLTLKTIAMIEEALCEDLIKLRRPYSKSV